MNMLNSHPCRSRPPNSPFKRLFDRMMLPEMPSKSAKDMVIEGFITGLKGRSEELRIKTAKDLQRYVTSELQETNVEDIVVFMDTFSKHVFEMINSADVNAKKGGILAIIILVAVDVSNLSTHCSRFANYLRNQPSNDVELMELTAFAVGKVAQASGQLTASYVEYEVKRAIEWLGSDKNETKRHGAVSTVESNELESL